MKHVAVVEDNPDGRRLVQLLLEGRYRVSLHDDGASALAALPTLRPDLVLLDISLPDIDGEEVFARLRAEPALAGVPIVALTAHALAQDRERLLQLGFDGYVCKPLLDPQRLHEEIEAALASAGGPPTGGRETTPHG